MNKVWIDTDLGGSDPDDYQAMIYALTMHISGAVKIIGISAGYPRGKVKEIERVLKAFKRDGFELKIPIYKGGNNLPLRTIRALQLAKTEGALFCAWGALTTFADFLTQANDSATPLHAITSWNREQDQAAYDDIKSVYKNGSWIDNEKDFRRIYLGWDLKKNRAWVKKIAAILPRNVRRIWVKAANDVHPSGTWKGGDVPSFHWAMHYELGDPMKYTTRRRLILGEFERVACDVFGGK